MRRRTFLRAAGSAATLTAAAAATSGSAGAATSGTTHTVEMNDQLAFVPERIEVAPGDTVVWENVGSQGHSVTAYEESLPEGADYWASGGFDSEQAARDGYEFGGSIDSGNVQGGESYSHTFETEGTYEYFCIPHEAAEMVGEVVVTENPGTVAPTDTPAQGTPAETPGETPTDPPGGNGSTRTVEMTDGLAFEPDSLTVAPGDTVVWENVGNIGHSVTAYEDSIPDGAEYWASGGFDSQSAAEDAYSASGSTAETGNVPSGESYSHTFETEGTHEYFCIPHEAGGMVGQIEVSAGGDGGDGGDDSLPIGVPGLILGGLGIGVVSFVTGVYYGGKRKGREQSTAALAGAGAIALGLVLMIAIVARLLMVA